MPEEQSWGSLGELFLREGLITDSQLTTALQVQKNTDKSLGRVLVEMGLITERVRMRLLQQQLGYDIVQINPQRVERMVLDYIPKSVALKNHLVPLRLDLDTLVVGMEEPTDVTLIDHLKQLTGFKIKPVIASVEDIEGILADYPEEAEILAPVRKTSLAMRLFQDVLLFVVLAAPIVFCVWFVSATPELTSRFAQKGAYVDVFIFTLLGFGIYAVVVFEIWSLIFQKRGSGASEFPKPPSEMP